MSDAEDAKQVLAEELARQRAEARRKSARRVTPSQFFAGVVAGQEIERQVDAAIAWLRSKEPEPDFQCDFCGQRPDWQVTPVVSLRLWSEPGGVFPMFSMSCANCGNTKFFNAVLAGVLPSEPGEENE